MKLRVPLTGVLFAAAGVLHFLRPAAYASIMPPGLGHPAELVALSGAAEIAGGLGLLLPRTRRAAGYGLIALLLAVWPANIGMALHPERFRRWRRLGRCGHGYRCSSC
jgi:uncharacterized membrane protein